MSFIKVGEFLDEPYDYHNPKKGLLHGCSLCDDIHMYILSLNIHNTSFCKHLLALLSNSDNFVFSLFAVS
jgi:hypothetical protein